MAKKDQVQRDKGRQLTCEDGILLRRTPSSSSVLFEQLRERKSHMCKVEDELIKVLHTPNKARKLETRKVPPTDCPDLINLQPSSPSEPIRMPK